MGSYVDERTALEVLLTGYRKSTPCITEVFLAALGVDGDKGFQCELGFGDGKTMSFQDEFISQAIHKAYRWAADNCKK